MSTGFCAAAIAVFMSTPSQPSSIAMAASLAVPTPASTRTGTVASSTMKRMLYGLRMPSPEPIGAASGITATQPISANRLATIGSSLVYTMTLKPSAISVSAAIRVWGISGYRVFSLPSTSSFTSSCPSSSSRASRQVRTASSAL